MMSNNIPRGAGPAEVPSVSHRHSQNGPITENRLNVDRNDLILITGSNGFIGSRVVETLLRHGFSNLRCFARPSSNLTRLRPILATAQKARIEVIEGNLLHREDCEKAAKDATVIFHLAAGKDKSFPSCVLNSVVATRNLLDAVVRFKTLRRFVNISGFDVYSNWNLRRGALLDETCTLDSKIIERADAPGYAKLKQDELVLDYAQKYSIPYVILRPCTVYGPGWPEPPSRVGIGTFGIFLHLGGSNRLPLSYVDNCAEAIVLAGIKKGVDGEVFNVVDDDLPTSRQFLRLYKRHGRRMHSIYVPYPIFYWFCSLWGRYSKWSGGQLPPAFNRRKCAYYWKGNRYSNQKLKDLLGWKPVVPFSEASKRFFEYVRQTGAEDHA
jgi:nucleoside-diphosphate-sugar epimerase